MSQPSTRKLKRELGRLLEAAPDTQQMELLIPDLSGILKGKRIQRDDFDKACAVPAFGFCGGTVLLSSLGEVVDSLPYGAADGDPDLPCALVPGSIAPIPWARRPMAQALFRMYDEDESPFFADPRAILERNVEAFTRRGLTVVMATELEFYLLADAAGTPVAGAPTVPGSTRPQPGPQVYHPDDLWAVEQFLDDVYDWCKAQNVPADAVVSEYSQGQFEINLRHVPDPVLACDHAVLLKRIVKAAARRHGFVACFMAKPFAGESGNGLHLHMSFKDRDGNNWLSHGREKLSVPPFSARLRHAVGGLLKTMADATAIFAPNMNSYRRLRPENFAPVEPNWGTNHRAVAVRIPLSDEKNLRIEHRAAGADSNPYLVAATVLAGIDHGLREKCDPGTMVETGQVVRLKTRIPVSWSTALDRFARSRVLPDYLGADYCRFFAANRRFEMRNYQDVIPQQDFDWYLRSV